MPVLSQHLKNDAWLRHAAHANYCAALLEEELCTLPEVELMFPRQANAVFARMPEAAIAVLRQRGWLFYTFIGVGGMRLMCAWDTEETTVRAFIADVKAALRATR